MSIYLTRTVLLSLGIALIVTTSFYILREEMKLPQLLRLKKPAETFSATYTLKASDQSTGKHSLQENIVATNERLSKAGYDFKVQASTENTYTVSVESIRDTFSIRDLLTGNGRISFNEVYTVTDLHALFSDLMKNQAAIAADNVPDSQQFTFLSYVEPAGLYASDNGFSRPQAEIGFVSPADTGVLREILSGEKIRSLCPHDIDFLYGDHKHGSRPLALYGIRKNPDGITNKNIQEASSETDYNNNPAVGFNFDAAGSAKWERLTERNIGKYIAICINNKVIMAPNVLQKITGGQCRINLDGKEACNVMSILLTSPELALPVRIIQSEVKTANTFSFAVFSPFTNYIIIFLLSFAMSFCIIWFVFKPGKRSGATL